MSNRMDSATAAHFKAWVNANRVPADMQQAMRLLWSDDPAYWSAAGWSSLENAVHAL